jgi:hypothetical protein
MQAVRGRQHRWIFASGWSNLPAMIHLYWRLLTVNKDDMLVVGNPLA